MHFSGTRLPYICPVTTLIRLTGYQLTGSSGQINTGRFDG